MSDCRTFEEDLVAFRAGECSPARCAEIDLHLSTCAPCRAFLDDVDRVRELLSRVPEIEPSQETERRIAATARRPIGGAVARRPRAAAAAREPLMSGAAIGFDYVRFQLARRPTLRIVGAIAAALAIHALAFAALRAVRAPGSPEGPEESNLGAGDLPAEREGAFVLETLGDVGFGIDDAFAAEPDLRDPEVFGVYRDAVARQTDIWNTRSRFRLDVSIRLDPEARRKVFAALGDPEGVEAGIDRGLDYLSATLLAAEPATAAGAPPADRTALSALSTLAFLGRGSSDSYGPYRDACRAEAAKLLSFLEAEAGDASDTMTRALALWALAENSALSETRLGSDRIQRVIAELEREQLVDGGWGARAGDAASDPLASAVVASALAIGARSGFAVPTTSAAGFAERFALPRLADLATDPAGADSVATASLLLALELWRPIDARMTPPGGAVAAVERILTSGVASGRTDLLLFERGLLALQLGSLPEGARAIHGTVARRILEAQRPNGEVDAARFDVPIRIGGGGPAAATALAVLILEIPCRYRSRV